MGGRRVVAMVDLVGEISVGELLWVVRRGRRIEGTVSKGWEVLSRMRS